MRTYRRTKYYNKLLQNYRKQRISKQINRKGYDKIITGNTTTGNNTTCDKIY